MSYNELMIGTENPEDQEFIRESLAESEASKEYFDKISKPCDCGKENCSSCIIQDFAENQEPNEIPYFRHKIHYGIPFTIWQSAVNHGFNLATNKFWWGAAPNENTWLFFIQSPKESISPWHFSNGAIFTTNEGKIIYIQPIGKCEAIGITSINENPDNETRESFRKLRKTLEIYSDEYNKEVCYTALKTDTLLKIGDFLNNILPGWQEHKDFLGYDIT